MKYVKEHLRDFKRERLLTFTDSKGSVHKIDDSERQHTETFSRVMGYYRPIYVEGVPQWNPGKVSEHNERVWFKQPKGLN